MNAIQATQAGIRYMARKVRGRGGFIVIDREGNCSCAYTTKKMIHGWIELGGEATVPILNSMPDSVRRSVTVVNDFGLRSIVSVTQMVCIRIGFRCSSSDLIVSEK